VAADAALKSFAWSSWPAHLLAPSKRPAWLRVERLLGEWGIPKDSPAGRPQLERALEERREAEEGEEFKPIRRGWCLGGGNVSQGLAGADERTHRGGTLRRGTGANGGSAERTNHRGGIEAAALAGSGPEEPAQGGCWESSDGGAPAGGDDDDGGVDRGAFGDGNSWLPERPAVSAAKEGGP
jgi:hypothetical protein